MKFSKEVANMCDELGNQVLIGLWFLTLAGGLATIFSMIACILGECHFFNIIYSAVLTGFFLYIIIAITKEKNKENIVNRCTKVESEKILDESLPVFERMRQATLNGEIVTQPFTERYEDIILPLTKMGWSTNFLHWGFRTDDNIDITVVKRTDGFELEMRLYK